MRYVPRHLPNKLEYNVLSCISVHYQSRMASNGSAITPPYPPTVQAGQWYYSRLICWSAKYCGSKIYTLYSVFSVFCIL